MSSTFRDIAVIIVNWNSGKLLERSLLALENQAVAPSRIIVVDNASSDGSADGVEVRYPHIETLRLEENIGFAAANNHAVKSVTNCKWVALLNPDAFAEPDWLLNLLKAAESHPEFSFFASRLLKADDAGVIDGTGDIYHVSGRVWRRDHGVKIHNCNRETGEVFSPCAAAAMYKTEEFIEASGFDENYFCYSEDVDLGFRMRLMGRRCLYVDNAVVSHVGSASTKRHSDFQIYHGHRNLVWTFVKNMPWPLFWIYLPQHLLMNLIAVIVFSLKGRMRIILKAKWDAIKSSPRVLRQRRKIHKARNTGAMAVWKVMTRGLLKTYFPKL